MKEAKATTITFRISTELKKALQAMAVKDKRSLSNIIEVILDAAVKNDKKKR